VRDTRRVPTDTQSPDQPTLLSPDEPISPSADRPTPTGVERSGRSRITAPDAALAGAVEQARAAAAEITEPGTIGEYLGVIGEGERVVTHSFACTAPAYRGWRWAITLARSPRSKTVTVSETHLLPDEGAVLAPQWLPWSDRLAPGDLSPGDVLPLRPDDPLLEQGFEAVGDGGGDDAMARWELGLGRPRVLSREGRQQAAQRWYEGEHGPQDPFAEQAPAHCTTCGFFLPMPGALRAMFGVCANEWSPADGKVVSLDHGCGAHSEVDVDRRPERVDPPVLDELGYIEVDLGYPQDAVEVDPVEAGAVELGPVEGGAGGVDVAGA
jgi:hypothetical protein